MCSPDYKLMVPCFCLPRIRLLVWTTTPDQKKKIFFYKILCVCIASCIYDVIHAFLLECGCVHSTAHIWNLGIWRITFLVWEKASHGPPLHGAHELAIEPLRISLLHLQCSCRRWITGTCYSTGFLCGF